MTEAAGEERIEADPGNAADGRWRAISLYSRQVEKRPPCQANCPSGTDIRGWLAEVAQHERRGITRNAALTTAWTRLVEFNPFPAVMGRVCPHTCEGGCNRGEKDGAVAIHALERYIGDWGLSEGLDLPTLNTGAAGSVAVVGSGPAGLSCAYQLARRGYAVTLFEAREAAGGMMRWGIPDYRLPPAVLNGEIARIERLGVEVRTGTAVGGDITLDELRQQHRAVFLAIGAGTPRRLRIPGEEGVGAWGGVEFMERINRGEPVDTGRRVVVVGGGNTAIDAARSARRLGAEVTMLYRRTRDEMPAIDDEVDEALEEEIAIRFLAAPLEVVRGEDGRITGVRVQTMVLGEPDASGRRSPEPADEAPTLLPADTVIAAVSQTSDWTGIDDVANRLVRSHDDGFQQVADDLWVGGDALGLGTVTRAVGHGRRAAESIHAVLAGLLEPAADGRPPVPPTRIRFQHYRGSEPVRDRLRPASERLADPILEPCATIDGEAFMAEAQRCLSCGHCFGCRQCWMYCGAAAYRDSESPAPGAYFKLDASRCEGCGKCIELCPCGFLDVVTDPRAVVTT